MPLRFCIFCMFLVHHFLNNRLIIHHQVQYIYSVTHIGHAETNQLRTFSAYFIRFNHTAAYIQ